ncbi:hypothetical protein EYF80_058503 [Liparis tanakae]|uniref:Uncharacterized protein n=1 Tax=Liparis tanakae TaxID=230148 RepID=A0A4Z2ESK6_9TELE|nr:hypothetical protein EYF80_058503 [Liparis tanakae]
MPSMLCFALRSFSSDSFLSSSSSSSSSSPRPPNLLLMVRLMELTEREMQDAPRTLGLLPPMAPGLMEPVSWYRHRILDTQPWETRSCREMTHGLMPWCAISTILCRMWLGRGLPLMKTPPSWFTRP